MSKHFTMNISGLTIKAEYNNERIAEMCRDYIVPESAADIEIEYDGAACKAEADLSGHGEASAEFACMYRKIAELLPFYSRAVVHGAVIEYAGKGYMFIAKSGTGKTTHIKLWQKYFEGVSIINGDKPILKANDKDVVAYGTPWAGKEMMQENKSVTLAGICLIKRAKTNSIRRIDAKEALTALFSQIYIPEKTDSLALTMRLIDAIICNVPFYELSCDISREAAECSFGAMTDSK